MGKTSVCILPEIQGTGGPASFQVKLKQGLKSKGILTHHNIHDPSTKALLVIGGTRRLQDLFYAKRKGIRIVQRLDGMNWLHKKEKTGLTHYLRSEGMNLLLSFIRRHLADLVVYQSKFTQSWWITEYGPTRSPDTVIYNGVDLRTFKPNSLKKLKPEPLRLLVVEGSFKGGHARDLQNAVGLANTLAEETNQVVELLVAGNVPDELREEVRTHNQVTVKWLGLVPHNDIPALDRSAHLIFPAEINAACPNSLIEALACGLPVISYATGSIPELVGENGGIVVPYGANYWNLEPPKTRPLALAAKKILNNRDKYSHSARKRAEEFFSVESMVTKYHQTLMGDSPELGD